MALQKHRSGQKPHRMNRGLRNFLSIFFLIVLPPVGIVLVWRGSFRTGVKAVLCAVVALVWALGVMLLPSADNRVNGGIELVGIEREVEVYGPALPTAMVKGYTSPLTDSVFIATEEEETEELYRAAEGADCYHRSTCKFAYASSDKLTLYEAHFLGFEPCGRCNPPPYVPEN